MVNYYAVLGLRPNASDDEIKMAYRQNAKRYHPDLNPDNESFKRRFLEIKTAYEILGDANNKRKYDSDIAAYVKKKQTQSQTAATQTKTASAPPPAPKQAAPIQAPTRSATPKIEELKKMHSLQLELLRVASKENMLKYRKRLQEQLDSYRKEMISEREKEKRHHKAVVDKMLTKMKTYKSAQKKDSFNSGYQKGMKAAQESAKRTIDELKSLLSQTNVLGNKDAEKSGGKKIQTLQMELSLINEKNRELEQQIELLERISKADTNASGDDDGLKLQFEQAAKRIDDLTDELDKLKYKISHYENEIDLLNEEILFLEGFIEIWQEISADNTVTSQEHEIIEQYASERNLSKGTLYGALGLPLNALPDEIRAAYTRLKKRYENKESHFDRYMEVLDAYNTLSDPAKKKAYDISINNEDEI